PNVTPGTTYYRFTTAAALRAEIDADLAALRARFPGRVDDGPLLYAGTSQGANLGAALAIAEPARFPRIVLTEGGHDRWSAAAVRAFAEGGGQRVLFACGLPDCAERSRAKAALLAQAGVAARVVYGAGAGHVPYGRVFEVTREARGWLLEGEKRW